MLASTAAGVWTVSPACQLNSLDIVRGERRECYPKQSDRIVGVMSNYRANISLFCISRYRCEVGKECTIAGTAAESCPATVG